MTVGTLCPGFVSEAGMWANSGSKAPPMLREVSPQKCANAVLKVIAGSSQELVSSGPIRPLLALAELAPGLNKPILKRLASCADVCSNLGRILCRSCLKMWQFALCIDWRSLRSSAAQGDVGELTGSSM